MKLIKRLIRKIKYEIEWRKNWSEKMDEPLRPRPTRYLDGTPYENN